MVNNTNYTLPNSNNQVLAPLKELNFYDSQSVEMSCELTPFEAWRFISTRPAPILKIAFRIRDAISAWFGVKQITGFSGKMPKTVKIGDKLDFFLVENATPDVLTLSARDHHLDVLTCISMFDNTLTVTSSVITHNLYGRIYMIPVAPAHKIIVRNALKQLRRNIDKIKPAVDHKVL